MNLKIISAGAGSGKTYRLTSEMVSLLQTGAVRANGIIATTFTNKAAAELQERVRVRLLEEGLTQQANDLGNALIGTVHGLGVKLLKRFAFEAGVSPQVDIIADEDQQLLFNQSLAMVLTSSRVEEMGQLSNRLGLAKSEFNKIDWRKLLKEVTEVVRTNDFSAEVLERSKQLSFESLRRFFDDPLQRSDEEWRSGLLEQLDSTIEKLENGGDTTKVTADGIKSLRELRTEIGLRGDLYWHQWVKAAKTKVGAKSRDAIEDLLFFANSHLGHQGLHDDIKSFIFNVFDLAQAAIEEFGHFKKSRGLIDYTDMEVLVRRLLDEPTVQDVLTRELDLLMVDEFQDTNPLQLEIFLKLSQYARHSIWVGDPKQSIYGFRGADPQLMEAIIEGQGGLKKENILEHSWRSREDIVFAANAIFTKAFSKMPPEQVALQPKRRKLAAPGSANKEDEPLGAGYALQHWNFKYDGEGRKPGKEWFNHCIAVALKTELDRGLLVLPKGEKNYRHALPGDVAILCRSNHDCRDMAEALHRAGLRAAISRAGLIATAESKLILACLKFILNKYDSLSIAEILLLAARLSIEEIVENRLSYLETEAETRQDYKWGEQNPFIQRLNSLRYQVAELSGTEILTLLLEELDLRRLIVSWGNAEQRLANIDVLCRLAQHYEDKCNRLHSASSLGGLLLWLHDLEANEVDLQASGESQQAVNVITYHKSKGLEYPVVICHSLEAPLREEVWGLAIVPEKPEIDLNNLLGNRWLRLWVNPYADLFRNTVLEERINESAEKAAKRAEALAEEARLLYVGLTRARDYLVFPSSDRPLKWLNRVCHAGDENRPALEVGSSESNWEWDGRFLDVATQVTSFPPDFGHANMASPSVGYLPHRQGRAVYPVYAPKNHADGSGNAPVTFTLDTYASPFLLPEVPERQLVAKAFRAFLLNDPDALSEEQQALIATGLIHRFGATNLTDGGVFFEKNRAFLNWIERSGPIENTVRQFPVRGHFNGQLFEESVDLVIERKNDWALVTHCILVVEERSRQKKLKEMAGKLAELKKAFEKSTATPKKVRLFVHFVLYGAVYEAGA